jgi:pyrroline-5-carboxylate reductase
MVNFRNDLLPLLNYKERIYVMKIGFIGCGNMATAIIGGILKNQIITPQEILAFDKMEAVQKKIKDELGICLAQSNVDVVQNSEVVVLAVKPQFYPEVISEIRSYVTEEQLIVTIAPGKSLQWLEGRFGHPYKFIRTMPNTPALVGEGITAACASEAVSEEDKVLITRILNSFGQTEWVSENLMDVVVSVSGSSPAYVFMFIEAMADAAVADGMPRTQAYKFAAQAVLGSAKMVLETGKHPGELKDMVCSPAGTTIEAVRTLEKLGFRSAVIEAMKTCTEKSKSLS